MTTDTIETNRTLHRFDGHGEVWLFGYGSLIYKADFPFLQRRPAEVRGWSRRFWQGSHDHRGTADAPGRVVTLIASPAAVCAGVAYLITPAVFDHLDRREKNGYLRHVVTIDFRDRRDDAPASVAGLVYIADPVNAAFLGPATDLAIARQIALAAGPSGANRDYLTDLAAALRALGEHDAHVFALVAQLRAIDAGTAGGNGDRATQGSA